MVKNTLLTNLLSEKKWFFLWVYKGATKTPRDVGWTREKLINRKPVAFQGLSQNPKWFIAPVITFSKSGLSLLCRKYGKSLVMKGKFIQCSSVLLLVLIKFTRWHDKLITVTKRMKAQIPRRKRDPQSKATKTFHAKKKIEKRKNSVESKKYVNWKVFWQGNAERFRWNRWSRKQEAERKLCK